MNSYLDFRREFDTVPVYTRRQFEEALTNCVKQHTVNRVIQKGKDYDVALQIVAIHSTPDGLLVIVR